MLSKNRPGGARVRIGERRGPHCFEDSASAGDFMSGETSPAAFASDGVASEGAWGDRSSWPAGDGGSVEATDFSSGSSKTKQGEEASSRVCDFTYLGSDDKMDADAAFLPEGVATELLMTFVTSSRGAFCFLAALPKFQAAWGSKKFSGSAFGVGAGVARSAPVSKSQQSALVASKQSGTKAPLHW